MLPDYSDIINHADTEPIWFDQNGVPRFESFHPQMLGVYTKYALYATIACQSCGKRFNVGCGYNAYDFLYDGTIQHYELDKLAKNFHYGDPPPHGCMGDTMNCEDIETLQVYELNLDDGYNWVRVPELEGLDIRPDWAKEPY